MEDTYEVYFHGRSPPSGDPMLVGAALLKNGTLIDEMNGAISYSGSPSRAQWEALIQGMALAAENGVMRPVMKGDSREVINYMNGEPLHKGFDSVDYFKLARKRQLQFNQCFFQWIPLEKNAYVINLAVASMQV